MADGGATSPRARRQRLPLPEPCALRREDAAAYVGLSPGSFDKAVARGDLPEGRRIGGVKVWPRAALERALDPNHAAPANSWDVE